MLLLNSLTKFFYFLVIFLMRLLPWSARYIFPDASVAKPFSELNCAVFPTPYIVHDTPKYEG
jgi:hypothetical protein